MKNKDLVLLDTCVLMSNPDIIFRVNEKGGAIYITNTVLDELDYNKKGNEDSNRNARLVLKELAKQGVNPIVENNGIDVFGDDVITHSAYKGIMVNIIHRDVYRSINNNDAKIIEIAKDYSLILISADQGMVVRASASGVESRYWKGGEIARYSSKQQTSYSNRHRNPTEKSPIKPFRVFNKPIEQRGDIIATSGLPMEGDSVSTSNGKLVSLKKSIGIGGEGEVFLTDDSQNVCKIYKQERLTKLKRDKINLMLTRSINEKGIAWPNDYVVNKKGDFVGYIMPMAKGVPLQPTIFVKPHFEKCMPHWTRRDLAVVCLKYLEHMQVLHKANILVGDINPLNVLVNTDSSEVWLVDTDSFQVENYPCPVGTINFTAPEIQGKNYATFLRTKEHELFAVATMLFMILLPGKPPYSQQGGGTPGENIKRMLFPYPFHKKEENIQHHGINLPSGPYRYMWSHLSYGLKEAFHETFRENIRVPLERWKDLIEKYLYSIEQGYLTDELFPKENKITDGIEVSCVKCGTTFTAQKQRVNDLEAKGKGLLCADCLHEYNLRRLAQQREDARASTAPQPSTQKQRVSTKFKAPHQATRSPYQSARPYGTSGTRSTQASSGRSFPKNTSSSGGKEALIAILTISGVVAFGFVLGGVFGAILAFLILIVLVMRAR